MCHDPNFIGPDLQRPLVGGRVIFISIHSVRRPSHGRAVARAGTPTCAHAHAGRSGMSMGSKAVKTLV